MNSGYTTFDNEFKRITAWINSIGNTEAHSCKVVESFQGWGKLRCSRNIIGETLQLGDTTYSAGFGTHANGKIKFKTSRAAKQIVVQVGVDKNRNSKSSIAVLQFMVEVNNQVVATSSKLTIQDGGETLVANLNGASEFTLSCVTLNTANLAHASWCNPVLTFEDGVEITLGALETPVNDAVMPISFTYGKESSQEFFRRAGISKRVSNEVDFKLHKFTATDTTSNLQVVMTIEEYKKLPAAWLKVTLKNIGTSNTLQISNFKSLYISWLSSGNIKRLHRANGSFDYYADGEAVSGEAYRDCFMPHEDNLVKGPSLLSATGGRSSVQDMPFCNYKGETDGLVFGIGWTGQWSAKVSADGDIINLESGLKNFNSILYPAEEIQMPSTLLIYYQGESAIRGHNLLRRFLQDFVLPKQDGKPIQAPCSFPNWGGFPAHNHLKRIEMMKDEKLAYDYYWIDAGWYGRSGVSKDEFNSNWGYEAGDWSVDKSIYPNGIKEISDAAHRNNYKFLLWGEPERAVHDHEVMSKHPDWFMGKYPRNAGDGVITNYGNQAALNWAIETFSKLIEENGVDCYRQDFNVFPLEFWQMTDQSNDRLGMTEVLYINGLYTFLKTLLARFPHLLIDNCAGGGRRLDLEMMRYSIPLWASDMQCYKDSTPERNLQHVQGLAYWLPQFAFGTQTNPNNTYHIRSVLAAGLTFHISWGDTEEIAPPDYPFEWHRKMLADYHKAKAYFTGDYYPLLEISSSFKSWAAYQFDRPDLESGIVLFFRKKESPFKNGSFSLEGLKANAEYLLEDADSNEVLTFRGDELLDININECSKSKLYFYKKIAIV